MMRYVFSVDYGIKRFIYVLLITFQELVMDILRVLSAPDLEVRKKTLNLALDLVTSRNIEEVLFRFYNCDLTFSHCQCNKSCYFTKNDLV